MIMNEICSLVHSLMLSANITNFRVQNAEHLVHSEEPSIADNDYESDIVITEQLNEWQIIELAKILKRFQKRQNQNVTVRMCDDGLRIFEREKEKS